MQLVQCIQLQQIELEQRATAAHERASEIAKEFARTIVAFEERLFGIEDNVQKEIMGIKTITEALREQSGQSRMTALERKMDLLLQRFDIKVEPDDDGGPSASSPMNSTRREEAYA